MRPTPFNTKHKQKNKSTGDELAQTHQGNNNWYGHDSRDLGWMHWDSAAADPATDARAGLLRFASELVRFRRACPLLRRKEFLA